MYLKPTIGIDFGEKFTGLAKFTQGSDPFPVGVGRLKTGDPGFWKNLASILEEEAIEKAVLGLPTYLDGSHSQMTKKVQAFGSVFSKQFPSIPLHFEEETLTTKAAEERMRHSPRYNFKIDKSRIDEVSAIIILEQYFKLT